MLYYSLMILVNQLLMLTEILLKHIKFQVWQVICKQSLIGFLIKKFPHYNDDANFREISVSCLHFSFLQP